MMVRTYCGSCNLFGRFGLFFMKSTALILAVWISSAVAGDLPPKFEADKQIISATEALKSNNWDGAIRAFSAAEDTGAKMPEVFNYLYGKALNSAGQSKEATERLKKYLMQYGESGKYYNQALAELVSAENNAKQQEYLALEYERNKNRAINDFLSYGEEEWKADVSLCKERASNRWSEKLRSSSKERSCSMARSAWRDFKKNYGNCTLPSGEMFVKYRSLRAEVLKYMSDREAKGLYSERHPNINGLWQSYLSSREETLERIFNNEKGRAEVSYADGRPSRWCDFE